MPKPNLSKHPPSALRSYCERGLEAGLSLADVLREINAAMVSAGDPPIRSNRLYEWLSGSRLTPGHIRDYCVRNSIGYVIVKYGGSAPDNLDAVADALR